MLTARNALSCQHRLARTRPTLDSVMRSTFVQRAVKIDGTVETIAGTGMDANSGDGGAATSASLSSPGSLHITSSGTIYVGLLGCVRKFTRGGTISKVAGSCGSYFSDSGDGGQATSAVMTNTYQSTYPRGIAVDESR